MTRSRDPDYVRAYRKDYRKRKCEEGRVNNTCVLCGRARIGTIGLCEHHFYENCAKAQLGSTPFANACEQRWKISTIIVTTLASLSFLVKTHHLISFAR